MSDDTPNEAIASTDPDAGKTPEQIADEVWEERDRKDSERNSPPKAANVPPADEETAPPEEADGDSDAPSDPDTKDEPDGTPDAKDAGIVDGHDAAYWAAQTKVHQAGFTRVSQENAQLKKDVQAKDRELGEIRAELDAHKATAKEFGTDAEATEAATKAIQAKRAQYDADAARAQDEARRQAQTREAAGEFASTYLTAKHGQEWMQIPQDPLYRAWAATNVPPAQLQRAAEFDPYALDLIIRDFKAYKGTLTTKQETAAREKASDTETKTRKAPMGGARPSKAAQPDVGDETADDVWDRTPEEHKRATEKAVREFTPAMRRARPKARA
jgi:hypothetical protein